MDFTLLQFLSGALADRLNITPTELLSAINALSAMPAHPYDQAKWQLFGSDHKFTTFQEIEVPEAFSLETAQADLSSLAAKHNETIMSKISGFANPTTMPGLSTFSEIQIEDEQLAKRNIVFSEAIRTLTLKEIDADPYGVAKKVISYYLSLH